MCLPVDVVAVDGVDVGLHDLIAHGLGDAGGDVAEVVDHTGLKQLVDMKIKLETEIY